MYNLNITNTNEVGYYKKINVTELRQMPEDELIKFFVDMSGGEFGIQMREMTEDEQNEVNNFIDNIPDSVFDEIETQRKQKIENKRLNLIQRCNDLINIIEQEIELNSESTNEANMYIDDL